MSAYRARRVIAEAAAFLSFAAYSAMSILRFAKVPLVLLFR